MLKLLVFDWGGTVMADSGEPGPMYLWKNVSWVPGAQEALEKLKGYPCCIATNAGLSGRSDVMKALERVGADHYFGHCFTSKDLGYSKPDPGFFRAICTATGINPEECVMTGNDYIKDICGAKNAGMRTVFYNPGQVTGPFEMADAVISNMNELPSIIALWNS